MTDLEDVVGSAVRRVRAAGTDLHDVEVKKAAGGLPKSLAETISAFANGDGGLVILGLDEQDGFAAVSVDVGRLADALATVCTDVVEPAVRAEIDIVNVDGVRVVAAVVPPLEAARRPCYVRTQGMERGSCIRGHDGDRHLTTYEVHALVAGRGQPIDDVMRVAGATRDDLDANQVTRLLERLRRTRGPVFQTQDDDTVLRMVGVMAASSDQPTLAGLLCLGTYPQQFLPQLNITFVAYTTSDGMAA